MKRTVPIILICLVTTGALGYGGYSYWLLTQENQKLTKQISKMKRLISSAAREYNEAKESVESLESTVGTFSDGSTNWSEIVPDVESEISTLSSDLDDIESLLSQAYNPDKIRRPFETLNPYETPDYFKTPDYFDTSLP